MKTLSALGPEAVLVGRLRVVRQPRTLRPGLIVRFWCPADRAHHEVPWPIGPPSILDVVLPLEPTKGCVLAGGPVLVALDPDGRRDHARLARYASERLRAWRAERRAAGDLADEPTWSTPCLPGVSRSGARMPAVSPGTTPTAT